MIYTFVGVLVFSMLKDLVEDCNRMWGDRKTNNSKTCVYNKVKKEFEYWKWKSLRLGDLVKVSKDE